ncbi:MAG: hypothetical protein NC937_06585 [Candidatus Omnitrophica bacterium]|nr:hypothetical protein [Candidatus Omnitrophota bacterium]
MNNLKQILLIWRLYIDDYNGYLPVCNPYTTWGYYDRVNWVYLLIPYTTVRYRTYFQPQTLINRQRKNGVSCKPEFPDFFPG